MKKIIIILFAIVIVLVGCRQKDQQATTETSNRQNVETITNEGTLEEISRSFFETYKSGDYDKVLKDYAYDPAVLSQLTPDVLKSVWSQLIAPNGEFIEISSIVPSEAKGYQTIGLVLKLSKGTIQFNVTYDKDQRIAGIHVIPYSDPQILPDSIVEKEVSFGKAGLELPGILTTPKGIESYPIVILVHGSGPNDKDETIGPNKPFRDIAWQLAKQGIGVLRYDKRTKVYPTSFINDPEATVYEETIEDARLAYEFLLEDQTGKAKGIYILGHSLGGYLMPRIAKEVPDANGYIILSGSVRPLEDLILEQINYISNLDGSVSKDEQQNLDAAKKLKETVKSIDPDKNYNLQELMGIPKAYWLDLKGYDPVNLMMETTHPTLILQGDRDYQVTQTDFNLWQEGLKDNPLLSFKLYKGLNHLYCYGVEPSTPEEYNKQGTVDTTVTKDIAGWILSQ